MDVEDTSNTEKENLAETPESLPVVEDADRPALVEALIFANGDPISVSRLSEISRIPQEEVQSIVLALLEKNSGEGSGYSLTKVAGGYQFRTRQSFGPFLRELKASKPRRLTGAALETLSIIAYRQPVVKSDIEKIRGVDVTPTIKTLLDRGFIKIVGHQATVGQPALYGTTEEFLKIFGLESLEDLPSLRSLAEIEQDPGETEEEAPVEVQGSEEVVTQ